jgi:conjugation system TraG family ATPase
MDAVPKQELDGAPQIFWAGMPGNAADFPMNDTFDTFVEQASCFLNLETSYRSSTSPMGIRLGDRLSGRPLHVDISDEPMKMGYCTNRNKFILGPSGSGKSFFTNHMVRSYYEQGTHIVLVDVGHSYKGLCEMVRGYYFTYDEKKPIRFNPFYISEGDTLDTEKKESIKTLLLALWKKDNESFLRSEYVALSNALQLYYEKEVTFRCFDSFYNFLQDDFVKVLKTDQVKEKDFDVSNFLYVLRPYYRGGEFDYLLNARENLDLLSERFIVFELDNIKDHPILFPVVTIIIMEVFISKMRKLKGIRKMILIEEAWKAIAREGMAEYIKYLFKTVRKFFGEAVVVTQEVDDIISSPIVKQTIINNSDCKILLDQSKYQNKFDQVQELLGLTEKEKAMVLSINKANDPSKKYKEVFISLGGVLSKVYRTEVSPEEYLAYTTEETEKHKLHQYALKFGGDIKKAIKVMAQELRTTGIALLVFVLCSCQALVKKHLIKGFIPGTYVRFSEHEFGKEWDTLVIVKSAKSQDWYTIERKWKYERVEDGKDMEPEYKRSISTGWFDEKRSKFENEDEGETYWFDIEEKILHDGATTYRKIQ